MDYQEIFNVIKTQISGQLNSADLPEGVESDSVSTTAAESVLSGFKNQASSGDLSGIMEMFSGKETAVDNPVMASASNDVVSQLSSKFGLDPAMASGLVAKFMPSVMNAFNSKAGAGGFDIQSIISQFTSGGIGDMVQNFFGDQKSDQNTPAKKSGGILDMIKGLFGK